MTSKKAGMTSEGISPMTTPPIAKITETTRRKTQNARPISDPEKLIDETPLGEYLVPINGARHNIWLVRA